VAGGDAEVLVDSLDNSVGTATTKLAGSLYQTLAIVSWFRVGRESYRSADLQEVLANGLTVVHGVEGCDFVNTHGGDLEHAGDLVHDADAGEAGLALTKIQEGHDSRLLVLGRVALEDLLDEGEVLGGELEGDARVVGGGVAVL
jgi:hypothetical protein